MYNNKTLHMIIRLLIVSILAIVGWFVFYSFIKLTFPFLIAALLAIFINPIVSFLEKKARIPRPLAVLIGIIFMFGIVGGILTLVIWKVIDGIRYLSQLIPAQIESTSSAVQTYFNEEILPLWYQGMGFIDNLNTTQRTALEDGIEQIGVQFAAILGAIGQTLANSLSNVVSVLPLTLTVLIFILLALYFISKDWNRFRASLRKKLPPSLLKSTSHVVSDLKTKVVGFAYAQLILISITAGVNLIGFIILKVEHPLTIALIVGLVDLLPYLGTGIILVPWAIFSLLTGEAFFGIGLLILYGITILLRQLVEPKVLSSNLGLNPLATLISLFVGLQLFGIIGLIIGPVGLVVFQSLYKAKALDGIWRFIKGEI
ncbi:sporulation integral membrane protein YtvI [Bacillus suaedae]|uniref:Sporulation integral membrane protein YtvI n=1 Tax=Halalkalibacter suaedae TaxID=2822140 RepID=A0A940WU23_9BACI|nr:sporulation integral membrane protein YtvI [Bacillus suaedae]MBP3950452.1 sporulation integral membrane protein YtvI [Bacillus suaedae]